MSWVEGLSPCWELSSSCYVNWDAWAAIGTALAVGVALLVGVLPEIIRRRGAAKRVRGYLYIAKNSLRNQTVTISKAIEDCSVADTQIGSRVQIGIAMEFLDVSVLKGLLPHSADLAPDTVEVIARCVVEMERGILVARREAAIRPGESFDRGGLEDVLVSVYCSIKDAYDSVAGRLKSDTSEFPEPSAIVIGALREHRKRRNLAD